MLEMVAHDFAGDESVSARNFSFRRMSRRLQAVQVIRPWLQPRPDASFEVRHDLVCHAGINIASCCCLLHGLARGRGGAP